MTEITRREFVKGAAVGAIVVAGAGALANCTTTSTTETDPGLPEKWDDEADIIVVGSGGGMAGAVAARDAGLTALVLEKEAVLGGSTALHSGVVSCGGGTSLQREAGIDDTPEEYYEFLMACARGQADADVVKALAYEIPKTFEWLVSLGAKFSTEWLYHSGPEEEPYYTAITPAKKRGALYPAEPGGPTSTGYLVHSFVVKAAEAKGVKILTETPVKELVMTEKDGVVGVKAEKKDGTAVYYKANKGVLLAAGGFAYNKEMLKQFVRFGEMRVGVGGPGATGDGIKMGQAVGADVRNMQETLRSPTTAVALGTTTRGKPRASYPSILVNNAGKRFVNEDYHSDTVGNLALGQDEGIAYQIFDDSVIGAVSDRNKPSLIQGNTIEELAEQAGINAEGLAATIKTWNEGAKEGKDTEFGKVGDTVGPIEKAPFYAFRTPTVYLVVTNGGLKVNAKCQVLDSFDNVVPRLYAAGLDAGGWLGRLYPGSGTAVGGTYTMSRIAAANIILEQPVEEE